PDNQFKHETRASTKNTPARERDKILPLPSPITMRRAPAKAPNNISKAHALCASISAVNIRKLSGRKARTAVKASRFEVHLRPPLFICLSAASGKIDAAQSSAAFKSPERSRSTARDFSSLRVSFVRRLSRELVGFTRLRLP